MKFYQVNLERDEINFIIAGPKRNQKKDQIDN